MNNYGGPNMKIKFIGIFLLVIVLFTLFIQGCFLRSCEYIDMDAWNELISRYWDLTEEKSKLEGQVNQQNQAVAALQAQKSSLEADTQVVTGDITSAEVEVDNLHQQSANNQAEIGNIDNQIAENQAEIAQTNKKLAEKKNDIAVLEVQIRTILGLFFCFAGDTLVLMADGSVKYISDIQAGEMVRTYDTKTREITTAEVMTTASGEADYYYLINGDLKVTPPHPFYAADGEWVKIENLEVGDKIMSIEGVVEITSIERVDSGQQIFNISVAGYHCFFVSANGVDFYLASEW